MGTGTTMRMERLNKKPVQLVAELTSLGCIGLSEFSFYISIFGCRYNLFSCKGRLGEKKVTLKS